MGKKSRVGIIGCTGRGDYGHGVDTAFAQMPEMRIVAVADEDEAGREEARRRNGASETYADYHQMLAHEQLDIVAICTRWVDQHYSMIMAAAEAGCHIYMEKPFCRTLAECDQVVQALNMRHLKLGIAHITQYSPVFDQVLSLIRDGVIGEVLELRGRGKEDRRGGGEDLWVLGSHVFAMMRSVGGGDPTSCNASAFQNGSPVTEEHVVVGAEGIGLLAGDHVHGRFTFGGRVMGYFASKRAMAGKPTRFGLQIFGSRGIIEIQSGYLKPAYILRDSSWSPGRTGRQWEVITSDGIGRPEPRTDSSYEGGHIAAIRDLITAAEQQTDTRCSATDGRGIVEMTAAVFESHRLKRTVDLPLMTRVNPLSLVN